MKVDVLLQHRIMADATAEVSIQGPVACEIFDDALKYRLMLEELADPDGKDRDLGGKLAELLADAQSLPTRRSH